VLKIRISIIKAVAILLNVLWLNTGIAAETAQVDAVCPTDFFTLPIVSDAKFCQTFAAELPATLSYHANLAIDTAKSFYTEALGAPESESMIKGRIVLVYQAGKQTVIISPDGQGSQVDILVK
jgi:hypothetical protein